MKIWMMDELLRERSSQQPKRIAYIFLENGEAEQASITYGELDRQARSIAARALSAHPGDRDL